MFLLLSVFEGGNIPYPKREFLTDDDNEDKSNSKSATATNSTHGQPPAKRVRVMPPSTSSSNMSSMSNYVSACSLSSCYVTLYILSRFYNIGRNIKN